MDRPSRNPLAALRALTRRRSTRRGADSALAIVMFTVILVVIQATSVRRSVRFDLTRNQRNTLAPQSEAVLDSLDRDVTAYAFFRQMSVGRAGAEQLLALYARHSPRFQYQVIDPDRNPDRVARLDASVDAVVIEAGDARRVVEVVNEESVTNALLQVTRRTTKGVYFVSGHGEKDIADRSREGYSAAAAALHAQGYGARAVSLAGVEDVPADCAVLVFAGPRQDLLDQEQRAVTSYLRRGGSALFMIDPRNDLPGFAALLAPYRLAVMNVVVLDALVLDAGDRTFDATVAKVRRYEPHPITRGFNFVTMFPRARAVRVTTDSTVAGLETRYLCITDEEAWGETDLESFGAGRATRDGVDIAGPLPIAAVASRTSMRPGATGGTSRVVVVGDSDYATNGFFGLLGNPEFFLNVVSYLAEDESLIRVRPRESLGDTVYITERQGRLVFAICIVLLPAAALLSGAVVVARRRAL